MFCVCRAYDLRTHLLRLNAQCMSDKFRASPMPQRQCSVGVGVRACVRARVRVRESAPVRVCGTYLAFVRVPI